MKRRQHFFVGLILLMSVPVWAQVNNTAAQPAPANSDVNQATSDVNNENTDTRMLTPPPVNGQAYSVELTSEERSNYLRGGLNFSSAYSDNVLGSLETHPVSDVSYSVAPVMALNATTSRERWELSYTPGFTFYQRTSARNESDQIAAIEFEYRLSPHVTFSAKDGFQKSSNVFNQPDLTSAGVSGGAEGPNLSIVAPVADRLSNSGDMGLTYQFGRNSMVGASGTFSNLHFLDPTEVPGLFDSSSQAGLGFYSVRISRINYVGVTYEYQRLLSYPTVGVSETQTHAALLFYTAYPATGFSISFFGGPQHSDTVLPLSLPILRQWTPAGGASLSWQGRLNSLALSYVHIISGGGGLFSAVQMDSANASVRQQLTKILTASVTGAYAQNNILGGPFRTTTTTTGGFFALNGHSIWATASLQQQFGQHLGLQLGYTRVHQDYSSVAVLALTPNTNREFVSLSYQFARPLGR